MSTAFHATRTAVSAVSIALAMWVYAPAANAQSFLGFKPAGKSEETSTKGSAGTSAKASACEEVYPGVWRIRFGEPEKVTPVSVREAQPMAKELGLMPKAVLPLDASKMTFRTEPRGCVVELPLEASEQLYGLGLHAETFHLKGLLQTLVVSDEMHFEDGSSHAPVPFYVSTRGYGVFVDTTRYARFYMGNLVKPPSLDQMKTTTSPADLKRDPINVTVEVPTARGVDVYLFAGPSMKQAVSRYNLFSGGGYLPPLWGLGVYYRGFGEYDAAHALKLASYFRDAHIPCDVFGLEPGWHSHSYSCSYVWSKGWPNPDEFIQKMKDMGFELNLWEHAFVHPTAPFYREIRPYCCNYEVLGGLVPDFLDANARRIFGDYHEREFVAKGIGSFKLDECDQQPHQKAPWSFPEFSRFPSGVDGEQMHSLFGIVYQQTIGDLYRKANRRTYGQVRSSHGLSSALPFVLYGDYYNHRGFVRALLNAGCSGLLWQPETRQAQSTDDLYRRLQTTVLSPQVIINAWEIPNPPWQQIDLGKNKNNELMPEETRTQAEAIVRDLFNLRMSLIPYLYSAFDRYRTEGVSPFRPLVLDYPSNSETHEIDDQYMMGDSIMVAPIFAAFVRYGHDSGWHPPDDTLTPNDREVYFPDGEWYCFWTHKKYVGPSKQAIHMPIDKPPMFVKAGSILPLAEPVEHVMPDTVFRVKLVTFGKNCRPVKLYEDDGRSFDFERDQFNRITISWDGKLGFFDRQGSYPQRRYDFVGWEHVDAEAGAGAEK